MPSLREIQRSFAHDIRSGTAQTLGKHIVSGAFPGERLLQVYRNNTYLSLTDALGSTYPVVARLVGDGFFSYMAHEFVDRCPPTEGTLIRFGAELATFVEDFPPAAKLSYLADVARLEWAWDEVFHEADHAPFRPESLADVPSERYGDLHFTLHPATRLLESDYPVMRIWEVNQDDWRGDQTVDLSSGGEHVLIARGTLEVTVNRLEPGPFNVLRGFEEGQTLEEALAHAGDPNLDLDGCLKDWVTRGIIVEATL